MVYSRFLQRPMRKWLFRFGTDLEIYLALAGAFGLIAMLLFPGWGLAMVDTALVLLALFYLVQAYLVRYDAESHKFQMTVSIMNYIVSALASLALLAMLTYRQDMLIVALISLVILFTCFVMNIMHRYLYGIENKGHYSYQLRLILLFGLILLELVTR